MIFRFDKMRSAVKPCRVLETTDGKQVVVCCIGDSAYAPFWPRGTGANHSIIFGLHTVKALRDFFKGGAKDAKALEAAVGKSFKDVFTNNKDDLDDLKMLDFGMKIEEWD